MVDHVRTGPATPGFGPAHVPTHPPSSTVGPSVGPRAGGVLAARAPMRPRGGSMPLAPRAALPGPDAAGARKAELDELKAQGKVTQHRFQGDDYGSADLAAHVQAPKLTTPMRDALQLAAIEAQHGEPVARQAVEQRLRQMGFDQPGLYDRIAERLQGAPVTINVRTTVVEDLLKGGSYLNQWERPAYLGDGRYAMERDNAEKTLHGLPDMRVQGPAAQAISAGWAEKNAVALRRAEEAVAEAPQLQARLQALRSDIGAMQQQVAQHSAAAMNALLQDPAKAGPLRQEHDNAYRELQALQQQAQRLEARLRSLTPQELQARQATLQQARQDMEAQRGVLQPPAQHKVQSAVPGSSAQVEFMDKRSEPIDRPHSAAINIGYRAGSAPKPVYGTSHLVLRQDVKGRSTLTGGDSLEQVYKKLPAEEARAAVGNFKHMGVALQGVPDGTLQRLAEEALNDRKPRPGAYDTRKGDTELYIEVQVFGEVKMARDVEKIVVDEDDLDAWAKGRLVGYDGSHLPARPKDEVKQSLAQLGQEMQVDVQYIRTGTSDKPGGMGALRGPGEHLGARRQVWEERGEAALKALRSGDLGVGAALIQGLPQRTGGMPLLGRAPSLAPMRRNLDALKARARQADRPASMEEIRQLADATLGSFYQCPFDPKHAREAEHVLGDSLALLAEMTRRYNQPAPRGLAGSAQG